METNYPLQIWVYTFCYNEEQILPYVIEYWKQYATKVVVYDNGSTDKSVEILKKYDWIEVRTYDTNNTFDPEKIQQYKSICYHEADGKADYVMVCDIDEVLLVNENLFPELILAKKDGTKLFLTKYYELINLTSSTNKEILIHNSVGYYGYHNTKIYKAILFDPSIKLCFSNYSLSYVTDIDYKTQSIATVHLKLMSSQLLFKRQSQLYSRLNKNCKYPDNALFYGTKQNVGTRISYIKLIMPYKCKFSKTEKYITVTNDVNNKSDGFIKFNELTWMPTEIQYKDKNKRLDCIIGVPVYKSDLTSNEEASFNQLCKIIENNYEICLICPADIDLTKYNEISEKYNIKLSVLFCAKQYFKGTACYSYLCETADFYECFKEYEYLLIYLLDGWIFKNNLDYFINLNVDYIGSPWKLGSFNFNSNAVGNGGVSLRRVEKFIQVCKLINPINCASKYINKEDLFFCKIMRQKTNLHIATVKEASKFSVTAFSEYFIKTYNNGELPMCVHSWVKEWDFWKKYIDINNDLYLQPPPMNKQIQPVKNDYKTRLELIKLKLAKNNNQIKPIIIKDQQKELKEQKPTMDIYTDLLKSYYGIKDKEDTIANEVIKVSTNTVFEYFSEKQEKNETNNKQKTVAIFCCGRLGNILFEIASSVYYANKIGANYYLVNENVNNIKQEYLRNINKVFPTLLNNIKIVEKTDFIKEKHKYDIIKERKLEEPIRESKNDLIYIDGYRECPVYWSNDKNFIFNLFKDDSKAINIIKKYYNINFDEYVAINIRRGDYLKPEVSNNLGNLSIEYFKNCIKHFDNNLKFLIISDDINWCKTLFKGNNYYFADKNIPELDKMVVDFWIQTICHDNIIGNSTFSWWAAYLNKHKDRKVYAPEWFFKSQRGTTKIPKNDNWILEKTIWDNTEYEYNEVLDKSVNTIKNKNVVYTCISGNVDSKKFKDPEVISPGFDYICYVDDIKNWAHIKKWQLRNIPEELKNLDPTKRNRAIKLNPHKYFKEYDLSVYVDGNVILKGDLNELLNSVLDNEHSIYIPKHPSRNCIYKEANICKGWKDTAENINPQIERFKKEGFPINYGLTLNNIIIRKHNNQDCIKLMEEWWNIVLNGSKRDLLSLFYVKWKTGIDIKILDTKLNNSKYFAWLGTH